MAAKNTKRSKATTPKKAKSSPKGSAAFPCPKKGDPFSLEEIVDEMEDDRDFAEFIRDLLCATYSSDAAKAKAARTCLASYYAPTDGELMNLCIPKKYHKFKNSCTVPPQNLLLAVPADRCAR